MKRWTLVAAAAAMLLVWIETSSTAQQEPVAAPQYCLEFYNYGDRTPEEGRYGYLLDRCAGGLWQLGGDVGATGETGRWFAGGAPADAAAYPYPCYELHYFKPYSFLFVLDRCTGNTWRFIGKQGDVWRPFIW